MNAMNSTKVLILVAVLFLGAGTVSNAQTTVSSSSFSIESIPQTPAPFENVFLKLSSFSIDLDRATISWFVDGELVKSGDGKRTLSFTVGDLGETSKVVVSVDSGVLGNINQSVSFTPSEVDLLWEAVDVYTPPFYKGKALPTPQSLIKVVAFPHLKTSNGNKLSSGSLIYKWKKNNKYRDFNNQSGYGKNSVIFRRDLLRQSEVVGVEVASSGGRLNGNADVFFGKYDTDIIFYERNPLEGISYEKALGNEFNMGNSEATIVAEPYFFSANSREDAGLSFEWRLNNTVLDPELGKSALTFRTDGEEGTSEVSLNIKHLVKFLQFTSSALNINFEN